ncbi:alpha/beta hydrolase fold [Saccharopolyspora antimicrobica]|uniref:Alpha/beta hydrolase family protein n=2 Tax=Saccharopolyspora antimicrobica TaxID=455193 RepID=A0A1I4V941_9PSEU|nr:alpha/beta hydrolase family protein [Saccharopolyspora antimicrobica]SFM97683.1 alpha/beta hydrolase fold [Saccharopolyspora antimicrobica]
MRRGMTSALGVLLAAGATLGATVPVAAAPALDWQPCPENAEVQCATLPVPLDWANPDGEQIEVAVARRPATDAAQRIGSLVFMPGGPGGTGVDSLLAGSPFSPELSSRFDIISYDPRGFGRSNPLQCDTELVLAGPDILPGGPEKFEEIKRYNREVAADCRARTGPVIDHMDAVSVARDIDAFRQALGEEQLSLYGISYGTLVGQMYAENFPDRVRALVLDSVMDHSLSAGEFLVTEAETAEDSFTEFAKWCAEDAQCALHGEDVGAVYDELYKRAEAGELHAPGDPSTPIGPVQLSSSTLGAFYGPNWQQLADQLKALRDDRPAPTALALPETIPHSVAAFCGDWNIDIDSAEQYAQEWQRQNEAAPHMRFGLGGGVAWGCIDWPSPVQNPQHVPQIRTEAPILVLNAQHDPATGYNWATNVDRHIEQATLLTYDGWGHGVYDRSECTTSAADRYFVDGVVPPEGTHCAAVPPTDDPTVRPYVGWGG